MKYFYLIFSFIALLNSCSEQPVKKQKTVENSLFKKASEYLDNGKSRIAFTYFNKSKSIYLQQKDSLGVGKCLIYMGMISTDNGDHFGAQEILLEALNYFNQKDTLHHPYLLSTYNTLAVASSNMKEYDQAIDFYTECMRYSKSSLYLSTLKNNIANAYRDEKKYDKALEIYNDILKEKSKDEQQFARFLTNISITKWLKNPNYNASSGLLQGLNIRIKADDYWGQNSSYAHLSDYYLKIDRDSALFYAENRYSTAKKINSPDDQIEGLKRLLKLSPPKEFKNYFEIYERLSDSIQTARSTAKNQFALIRYETEKHKADNLKLQKDNAESKYQVTKQKVLLYGTILLVLVSSVIAVFWYRKRKQRLELAAQNAIHENQLRTSKKVHDVVANGLYRVMAEIENQEDLNKDRILDKLEEMYEKSRDLSYEELKYNDQDFHERISALLTSFATETTKVIIVGNSDSLWRKVSKQVKYEIEHILQELMVNMKKHSHANSVAIKFELQNNFIHIYYTDNGIGMHEENQFNNGLTNTGNRIESINGTITFDAKVEKGLKIQVSFPFS